jgi:hypothetical protein
MLEKTEYKFEFHLRTLQICIKNKRMVSWKTNISMISMW